MTPTNPQPPQAPAQAEPPQGAPQGQNPQAVAIYQRLRTAAMKKIFGDPGVTNQVVQALAAGKQNPPMAVAHVAMGILGQVREKVTGIPPDVVYTVAPAIIAELGVLGSAAKLFQFTPQMFQQSVQLLMQQLKGRGQQQPPQAPGAAPQAQAPAAPAAPQPQPSEA